MQLFSCSTGVAFKRHFQRRLQRCYNQGHAMASCHGFSHSRCSSVSGNQVSKFEPCAIFIFWRPFTPSTCLCHPYGASLIFPFRCQHNTRSQSANWRQVDQFYSSYCQSRLCIGWVVHRQQPFDEFALLQQSSDAVGLALSSCN